MPGGEAISIMIGQCGVQTGSACWNLYGEEHGITPSGIMTDGSIDRDYSCHTFYKESQSDHFVPRTLFIDLEPSVIDELRKGCNRALFHPDSLINACQDSSNNFARGFYTCGRLLIKDVVFEARRQAESCERLQCIIIHHSYGGGTGAGFMSLLLEYLMMDYAKISKIDLGLIPNETYACSTIEPYNAMLGMHHPIESTDLAILYENEPIYNICKTRLNQKRPTFPQLNQIVSQLMSGITACTRFESPLGCSLTDIQTNIVPYPRIHFPLVTFAPIGSLARNSHSKLSTYEITRSAFHPTNQMVSVEANEGKVMACGLLYRGPISSQEAYDTVCSMKKSTDMEWVEWVPTGFKVGITHQPLAVTPQSALSNSLRSVTLLKNSTVVRTVFNRLGQKFWQLFSRKAFLHWFVSEGMEEKEFKDVFDDLMILSADLQMLEKDYEELEDNEKTVLYDKKKSVAEDGNENQQQSPNNRQEDNNTLVEQQSIKSLVNYSLPFDVDTAFNDEPSSSVEKGQISLTLPLIF